MSFRSSVSHRPRPRRHLIPVEHRPRREPRIGIPELLLAIFVLFIFVGAGLVASKIARGWSVLP